MPNTLMAPGARRKTPRPWVVEILLTRKNERQGENRVTVRIMGDDYTIVGSAPEDYINDLIKNVEKRIEAVSAAHGNAKLSKTQLAVLVALQVTDELQLLRMEHEKMVKLVQEAK